MNSTKSKVASRKGEQAGQGMVEFALAAPLLLLLIFGILEVGRMVFTYSSVAYASREAVRYGSATGYVSDTASNFRFRDCAGIMDAAMRVDFGAGMTTDDIEIYYYNPGGGLIGTCANPSHGDQSGAGCSWQGTDDGSLPNNVPVAMQTGSRIQVCTTGHWNSIVPGITGFSTRDMHSKSARTILSTIYINETIIAPGPTSPGGIYDLTPSATFTDTPTPSDTPTPCGWPGETCTPTPSPTPTDTPTETPTRTPTPVCAIVVLEVEDRPAGTNTYTVRFTNNGSVNVYATFISITWPTSNGTIGLVSASSNPNGAFYSGDPIYSGALTFQLTSGANPSGVLIAVGTSTASFTFNFSANFPSGVNRNHMNGTLTLDPVPQGCQYSVSY